MGGIRSIYNIIEWRDIPWSSLYMLFFWIKVLINFFAWSFGIAEDAPPDYNSLFGPSLSMSDSSMRPGPHSPVPHEVAIPMTQLGLRQPQSQMHPSVGRVDNERRRSAHAQDRSCFAYAKRSPEKSGQWRGGVGYLAMVQCVFCRSCVLFKAGNVEVLCFYSALSLPFVLSLLWKTQSLLYPSLLSLSLSLCHKFTLCPRHFRHIYWPVHHRCPGICIHVSCGWVTCS